MWDRARSWHEKLSSFFCRHVSVHTGFEAPFLKPNAYVYEKLPNYYRMIIRWYRRNRGFLTTTGLLNTKYRNCCRKIFVFYKENYYELSRRDDNDTVLSVYVNAERHATRCCRFARSVDLAELVERIRVHMNENLPCSACRLHESLVRTPLHLPNGSVGYSVDSVKTDGSLDSRTILCYE